MSNESMLYECSGNATSLCQEMIERAAALFAPQQQAQVLEWVKTTVAKAADILGEIGPSSIVLAALALEHQVPYWDNKLESGESLDTSLRLQIPRLRVMAVMGDVDDLVNDAERFHEYATLAARFLAALGPRTLGALLRQTEQLRERVRWFVLEKDQTSDEILAWAKRELEGSFGYDEAEAHSVIRCLGIEQLRTLSTELLGTTAAELLKTIACNREKWSPLVDLLTGKQTTSPKLRADLEDLLNRLRKTVRGVWKTSDVGAIEDAVQDAFVVAIDSLRDQEKGYRYEGSLLSWLTSTVLNRLRSYSRRPPSEPLPEDLVATPEYDGDTKDIVLLKEWRARYLLVETFFKGERSIQRVKAIFEWMLQHIEEDDNAEDDNVEDDNAEDVRLASFIEKRTGVKVNRTTLAGTRRRLRQRLEALRYMRDFVPLGAPDSWGDGDLLAHIKRKFGLADRDVPTIRALGGLARSSPPNRSLHWARLARLITNGRGMVEAIQSDAEHESPLSESALDRISRAIQMQRPHKQSAKSSSCFEYTSQRPGTSEDRRTYPEALIDLAAVANKKHMIFLLAPCWYLAIIDGRDGKEAVRCLKPASVGEVECIQEMVAELSRGISI